MAFKMKGFTPFTKKADGWRPHHTAEMEVSSIERKQARIDKKAAKGKDVSKKQERLDKRSERVYDREIARAERKEDRAAKKLEKGKGKQAARKKYKAGKIREAVSPLAKRSTYKKLSHKKMYGSPSGYIDPNAEKSSFKKDKKVPKIPTKSPHDVVQMLEKKKANGTITAAELKRLNAIKTRMETGPGSYGNEQWDKE